MDPSHLKVAAEIQTFLTLLVSIVLRSSLDDEIIQEDGYGVMLVIVNLSLALPLFIFMLTTIACKNAHQVARQRWNKLRTAVVKCDDADQPGALCRFLVHTIAPL